MNLKEKYSLMILDHLKKNKNQSFTVKQIGLHCFSNNLKYHHNVTEFLEYLNDLDYVTFTDSKGNPLKRSNVTGKVVNGLYKYKQGDTIPFTDKIVDLWKQETIKFIKQNGRNAYTTTEIAKEIFCDDINFITTQSIIMNILESEKVIYFDYLQA
jgi:hypothetical protein